MFARYCIKDWIERTSNAEIMRIIKIEEVFIESISILQLNLRRFHERKKLIRIKIVV